MYYFKQVKNGGIVSVEAKSVNVASPNFVETIKSVYDYFIASLPVIEPEPVRDLASEIDDLKAKIERLEIK